MPYSVLTSSSPEANFGEDQGATKLLPGDATSIKPRKRVPVRTGEYEMRRLSS